MYDDGAPLVDRLRVVRDLMAREDALSFVRRFPTKTAVGRPFDLRVWYVTGDILARLGREKEAAAEFARVVRHDPSDVDAAERLAELAR